MGLTKDQEIALSKLQEFVNSNHKYFRLTGYAGTGKSYLIAQFMQWLLGQKISFTAASPTNKAARNLARLAKENDLYSVEVTTVAKLLGQQPELNEDSGKEEFVTNDSSIGSYQVVIIDEFSMISKTNFEDITWEAKYSDAKIVFVGDAGQLPPVGEKFPMVAQSELIDTEATLNEVVRYDGDIAYVAEYIRTHKQYRDYLYPFNTTSDKTITCFKRLQWLEKAISFFKSDEYKVNPDYVRFLVWRNDTASALNNHVRQELWGKDAPAYVVGDRLIARYPVFRPNPNSHKKKDKWVILINNSEECEVIGNAVVKKTNYESWKFWEVPVRTDDGLCTTLRVLTEESEIERQAQLKQLKKDRKFWKYYELRKLFDNVPYSYAITTHKAQGSSIDYVFRIP